MTNEELNTRAFMATIKQAENQDNTALPYNAWNGFSGGNVKTFTDKTYEEAPDNYVDHLNNNQSKKGNSTSGAH